MAFQDHNVSVLNYKTLQVYLKTPSGSKVRWPVVVSNILLHRNKKNRSVVLFFRPKVRFVLPSETAAAAAEARTLTPQSYNQTLIAFLLLNRFCSFSVFNFNCVFRPPRRRRRQLRRRFFFTKRFVWTRLR